MYKKIGLSLILLWLIFAGKTYCKELTITNEKELEEALLNNEEQNVIKIKAGEYFGSFTISHPVHIIGEEGVKLIGPNKGNVLTIEADDVIIEGIKVEGSGTQNAGIYVKGNRSYLHNILINNVFHGIYARDSYGHRFEANVITSFNEGAHKGYGIYLVDAPNTVATQNLIHDTQDGIYVSYSDFCEVRDNQMIRARYGVHTMDSKNVLIAGNRVMESVNGMMIMQSYEIFIIENFFYRNTKIDGAGIFIFDTFDSKISSNIMMNNFKGILMENAKRNVVEFNTFLENNRGLELKKNTSQNLIALNNFFNNSQQIISVSDNDNLFSKDQYGNYYDDHQSLNLNDDKIVDFAYKSGDIFFNMTNREPLLQIFHNSPAVELWNMIEKLTPIPSEKFVIDGYPLVKPAPVKFNPVFTKESKNVKYEIQSLQVLSFLLIIIGSVFVFIRFGREKCES